MVLFYGPSPGLLMVLFNGPILADYGLDKRAAFGLICCLCKTRKDKEDMERQGGHGLLHYAAELMDYPKVNAQSNKTKHANKKKDSLGVIALACSQHSSTAQLRRCSAPTRSAGTPHQCLSACMQ